MGIFDRLTGVDKLRQEIESLKGQIAPTVKLQERDTLNEYLGGGYVRSLSKQNSRSELQKALKGFLGNCLDKLTDALCTTKFIVNKKPLLAGDKLLPVDRSFWLQQLLDNPNEYYNRREVLKIFIKWYYVNGNAYLRTPISKYSGLPISMWFLPSPKVRIEISQGGNSLIDGYSINDYGNNITYPPNEIIHIRNLEPSLEARDMILGKSILEKAMDDIDIEIETKEFLKRWFANDTNKPLFLEMPNKMDKPQWEVMKEQWNNGNPNYKLRGILDGGSKITEISNDGLEVGLDVLDVKTMRSIAANFGMSADLILYGSQANRASLELLMTQFMVDTVEPMRMYLDECFTKHFQQFDSSIVVTHEPFVFKDANEVRIQEDHDINHAIRSIDEVRAEHGYSPLPNGAGQTPLVKSGIVTLDSVLHPQQGFAALSYTGGEKKTLILNEGNKAFEGYEEKELVEYWKRYDKLAEDYKDTLQAEVSDVFKDLGEEVAGKAGEVAKGFIEQYASITVQYSAKIHDNLEQAKAWRSEQFALVTTKAGNELFDIEYWKAELVKRTGKQLSQYMITVIENALLDVNATYDELSDTFTKLVQKELLLSTEKITTSVDTVKEQLQEYLKNSTDLTVEELTEGIKTKFTQYSEGGANRIAQTTSTYTREAGKKITWGDFGIKRQWLSMRDGSVRAEHSQADGLEEDENGMFAVGGELMSQPAGGGDAANNVNCRCTTFAARKK